MTYKFKIQKTGVHQAEIKKKKKVTFFSAPVEKPGLAFQTSVEEGWIMSQNTLFVCYRVKIETTIKAF